MSVGYCEMPEFYHETFPRARKEHACCECSAPIEKGETHLHWRGKWDGEMGDGRQHELCRKLCMHMRDHLFGHECFEFGGLKEAWREIDWGQWVKERRKNFTEQDRLARTMYAQVLRRERRYRRLKKEPLNAATGC